MTAFFFVKLDCAFGYFCLVRRDRDLMNDFKVVEKLRLYAPIPIINYKDLEYIEAPILMKKVNTQLLGEYMHLQHVFSGWSTNASELFM